VLLPLLAGPVAEAERLAEEALRSAPSAPAAALTGTQRALALTAEFDPIAFVRAGRKGEVVEDEFLAARQGYRRHRARLYEAAGEALLRNGRADAARRHLGRAVLLDPASGARTRLARVLIAAGRARESLDLLLALPEPGADVVALAGEAADQLGLPSLQAELDRVRIGAAKSEPRPEFRDGPPPLPERARLSTGEAFRAGADGLTLIYVAEPSCRTCSADLLELRALAPPAARVALLPAVPDQDAGLRSVVTSYRHRWPYLAGAGAAAERGWPAPSLVAVARGGFAVAIARPPFAASLPPVLEAFARRDVAESAPRPGWNRLAVTRPPAPVPPGLLANGLAPGEDEPLPQAFLQAAAAFDTGSHTQALRLIEGLAAAPEAWLLEPEARFDRALLLAAMGRREEARRILLRIGDSRFQDKVDAALERIGSPRRGGSTRRYLIQSGAPEVSWQRAP
jgi:tetratricopeptide (TPR) repeat protein